MTREQFINKYTGAHFGDVKSLENKLAALAGFAYDALKPKGTKTAAQVAALTDIENGDFYRIITTGGNLNSGDDQITVLVGDVVTYNGETELWEFLVSGAAVNV